MSEYDDIYLRDSLSDTGVVPSTGTPCFSPDIITDQNQTLDFATAISTYPGPDMGKALVSPGLNNIYLRGKNIGESASSGTVRLYYALASLILLPQQWDNNAVLTASLEEAATLVNQSDNSEIGPGEICLGSPAFALGGLPTPGPNDHYCFIAKVDTPNHPTTIPASFDSNAAFASWVQNTPAVAWRNVAMVLAEHPTMVVTLTFGNANPEKAYVHFKIAGRSIPTGSTLEAQCTDQAAPFQWKGTFPAPDSEGNQLLGFDALVPANYTGGAAFSIEAPSGQTFSQASEVSVSYYQYPPAEMDELTRSVAAPVVVATEHPLTGMQARTALMVWLGECHIVCRPGGGE